MDVQQEPHRGGPPAGEEPDRRRPAVKGRLTIRVAAVLFMLSAGIELASITARAPWFGALRGGPAIVLYHLLFVVVFVGMGAGLWTGARWGYGAVLAGTAIYTADKVRSLFDSPGRADEIRRQLSGYPDLIEAFDINVLLAVSALLTVTGVLCWLGFAAYIHARRAYFRADGRQ